MSLPTISLEKTKRISARNRGIGLLTQPGGAQWNVGNSNDPGTGHETIEERGLIEFPGELTLCKNSILAGASASAATGSIRTNQINLW